MISTIYLTVWSIFLKMHFLLVSIIKYEYFWFYYFVCLCVWFFGFDFERPINLEPLTNNVLFLVYISLILIFGTIYTHKHTHTQTHIDMTYVERCVNCQHTKHHQVAMGIVWNTSAPRSKGRNNCVKRSVICSSITTKKSYGCSKVSDVVGMSSSTCLLNCELYMYNHLNFKCQDKTNEWVNQALK